MSMPAGSTSTDPAFLVVSGRPDAAEIAALVTVLAGRRAALAGAGTAAGAGHFHWSDRSRLLREPIAAGGGWRRIAAPR